MIRTIRSFAGLALFAAAALFTVGGTGRTAFAEQEDPKAEKKIEMPKLPEGSNPKWDMESVVEKFTVVKGKVNEDGNIYFLLELKEDIASIPVYLVVFTDSEGVKFYKTTAHCDPISGKKRGSSPIDLHWCFPGFSKREMAENRQSANHGELIIAERDKYPHVETPG